MPLKISFVKRKTLQFRVSKFFPYLWGQHCTPFLLLTTKTHGWKKNPLTVLLIKTISFLIIFMRFMKAIKWSTFVASVEHNLTSFWFDFRLSPVFGSFVWYSFFPEEIIFGEDQQLVIESEFHLWFNCRIHTKNQLSDIKTCQWGKP